jgi:hypothetical protein
MKTRVMPDGSVLHVHPQGAMQFHDLGGGVTIHACWGLSPADFAPLVIADGERLIREHGHVTFFVDLYDGKMASTGFREQMTEYLKSKGPRLRGSHMLLRSKLWEMAITVAQLVIRDQTLHVYSSIAEWEAVGRRQVPGFVRRPLVMPSDMNATVV